MNMVYTPTYPPHHQNLLDRFQDTPIFDFTKKVVQSEVKVLGPVNTKPFNKAFMIVLCTWTNNGQLRLQTPPRVVHAKRLVTIKFRPHFKS